MRMGRKLLDVKDCILELSNRRDRGLQGCSHDFNGSQITYEKTLIEKVMHCSTGTLQS